MRTIRATASFCDNSIVLVQSTEPKNPALNTIWIDTVGNAKRWNGSEWVDVTDLSGYIKEDYLENEFFQKDTTRQGIEQIVGNTKMWVGGDDGENVTIIEAINSVTQTATETKSLISGFSLNSNAKVFTTQPEPPYSENDLWYNTSSTNQRTKMCVNSRSSGSFTESDWETVEDNITQRAYMALSIADQTKDKFEWIVSGGTSSSTMKLTDDMLNVVAKNIKLQSNTEFSSLTDVTNGITTINGGCITAGSIKAAQIDITNLFSTNATLAGTLLLNGGKLTTNKERTNHASAVQGMLIDNTGISGYYNANSSWSFKTNGQVEIFGGKISTINTDGTTLTINDGRITIEAASDNFKGMVIRKQETGHILWGRFMGNFLDFGKSYGGDMEDRIAFGVIQNPDEINTYGMYIITRYNNEMVNGFWLYDTQIEGKCNMWLNGDQEISGTIKSANMTATNMTATNMTATNMTATNNIASPYITVDHDVNTDYLYTNNLYANKITINKSDNSDSCFTNKSIIFYGANNKRVTVGECNHGDGSISNGFQLLTTDVNGSATFGFDVYDKLSNGKCYLWVNGDANISGNLTATGVSSSSDARLKREIEDDVSKYENFFMSLQAKSWKYDWSESDRRWTGFIAQEVEQALLDNGLTNQDFAGIVIQKKSKDDAEWLGVEDEYRLRYESFVSLNTHMIQKNIRETETLRKENEELKEELKELREMVTSLVNKEE